MMIAFSTFNAVTDREPKPRKMLWPKLARVLVRHTERSTKGGPLWSPASYPPGATRARANVLEVSCLVADIDHNADSDTFDVVSDALKNLCHLVHTSHSHTTDEPAFRVVVPLAEPIQACAYDDIFRRWELFLRHCRIKLDSACSDPCRMYYLPTCAPGAERVAYTRAGERLDADARLPALPVKRTPPPAKLHTPAQPVDIAIILDHAVKRAFGEGRREVNAFWLAQQARDNGYSMADTEVAIRAYHERVKGWGNHPFTLREALQGLSAYKHPQRAPWSRKTEEGYASIR